MFRALLLILGVLGVSVPALAASSLVWFSTDENVCQVDSISNTIVRRVPMSGTGELATDGQQDLWVVTANRLVKLGANGSPLIESDLGMLALKRDPLLAVDPYDDRVWLSDDNALVLLDSNGQRLMSFPAPLPQVRRIQVGLDQSLWLLGSLRLQRVSVTGSIVSDFDLREITKAEPRDFVVDDLTGVLWLGGETELVQVDLATGRQVIQDIEVPAVIRGLALQPKTGTVWVATENALLAYGVSGEVLENIDLRALSISGVERLVFDPVGDSVWLTHKTGVARFSMAGELLARIATQSRAEEIAPPPFTLLPQLTLLAPASGAVTNNPTPSIVLQYGALCNDEPCGLPAADLPGFVLSGLLNGAEVGAQFSLDLESGQTAFLPGARLPEGLNTFAARAQDDFGHLSNSVESIFTVDTIEPSITIDAPPEGTLTNEPTLTVQGSLNEPATLAVNGSLVGLVSDGSFTYRWTLREGLNALEMNAVDRAGNLANRALTVTLDTAPPVPAVGSLLTTSIAGSDGVSISGADGSAAAGSRVRVTNVRTGETIEVEVSLQGAFSVQLAGRAGDDFWVTVFDAAGNMSAPIAVTLADNTAVPPDPASVAPPNDPTGVTQLADSTAFLYTGPNPIQTGVAAGTIEASRAIVLRGKILDRNNQALSGVTVTVLGHPEFGQTRSRADGLFDMAANGGGYLTLDYRKAGYLPVQRTVQTPWRDYVVAPEVVMIALDPQATPVALGADVMQVARGSVVSDKDGTRQATLLFPRGTTATMVMPDGSARPLGSITVRATEFTVGENGPQAMPGDLPPTSGYTYAAEYSVDEAIASGALRVQFNQPIYQYVDNFLGFPVGGIVPVGYYDRQKAAWIASDNGVVVAVLRIDNGLAVLDTDGDGLGDDAERLAALHVTESERVQLAALYAPGTTLWRVPITHFTPWDCNWPFGPPPGATPPPVPDPADPDDDKPDCSSGSIIECQNQTLGESVPVTGTPFTLNYKSSRTRGYTAAASVRIPLSGAALPPGVKQIRLEISVAGRHFEQSFPAAVNQAFTYTWDGLDAYGRRLTASQPARVRVGYVYDGVYLGPLPDLDQSFGSFGTGEVLAALPRRDVTLWKETRVIVGAWLASAAGLGGWTLNVEHAYDSNARILYLGDGRTRTRGVPNLSGTISTVAGSAWSGLTFSGDGGAATAASLNYPEGVALDAWGNLYIADSRNRRIRKVSPDGIISTVAGSDAWTYSGDGGSATAAGLVYPHKIAFDAQGNLYIADLEDQRIRKVTPDGIISTVAGNGSCGYSGDGGLATAAELCQPTGIAVDVHGNLYIADSYNNRVRKVTPDGIINTVAGSGTYGSSEDGGRAAEAKLAYVEGVAVDGKSNLYIIERHSRKIRKVSAEGLISTVAGNGTYGFYGDGGPATAAALAYPADITVDAQGNLYIADRYNGRVRRVTPDGIITTVAGNGPSDVSGDGGPATEAGIYLPYGVAVDPQGALYIADPYPARIRKVSPSLPGTSAVVVSEDGTQVFHFDAAGRHLRTLNALTGAVQFNFLYGTDGYIGQIADGDNNVTTIERDQTGSPYAIVAPDGQRTALNLHADGYLKSIANPAAETIRMDYRDGLLTSFTNARNHTSLMTYGIDGRLEHDKNAAGGFWDLRRSGGDTDYEVGMTSALGRQDRYRVEKLSTGDSRRTHTWPDGTVSVSLERTDGSTQTIAADGTVTTTVEGPDPRFGMQSPIASGVTVTTPSGLTRSVTFARATTLSDPDDLLSLVAQTDVMTVNGNTFTTTYDAAQRQFTTTTPLNRQSVMKIDEQGRPLTEQVTGIESVDYEYDERGRLKIARQGGGIETRFVRYAYNEKGYVDSVTDALEHTTRYTYDDAGRVKTITLPDTKVIEFDYDPNGNVTSITPPSRPAHGFDYSPVDLVTDYVPPALGTQTVATRFEYNLDKRPTQAVRPDGQVIDYGYDSGGRLESVTTPAGIIGYGYTPNTGQLKSVTAPGGIGIEYAYDGALPTRTTFTGPVAGYVGTTYDGFFRVGRIGVNGSNIAYGYDADGLLTSVGSLTLTRDPGHGLVTGSTLGQITTSQHYNAFGEPAGFTVKQGATVLFDEQYARDVAGRITDKTAIVGAETNVYKYDYDPLGRVTDVTKNGGHVAHFEYDANGNRTLAYGIDAVYDDQDRLTSFGSALYGYTANGELRRIENGGVVTVYDYDVSGNLIHAELPNGTRLDYLVDGRNRRIGKKVNGILMQGFLYQDQLKPAAELNASGVVVARFVYAEKANVPEYIVKGGVTYRVITDLLGSVRLVANSATGQIVQRMDYDEWGRVLQDTNPGFQPFGFAGGLYDRHTGLVRFGARDYDPHTGRWTAKDPIGFAGGDTGLYSYVEGNPLSKIDPEGLMGRGSGANGGTPTWGKGGPRSSCECPARMPDYLQFQLDVYIATFSGTFSRSGNSFVGGGLVRNYPNPVGVGASTSVGWLNRCRVTPQDVDNFIGGFGMGAAAGYLGIGGGVAWSPGAGTATQVGIGVGGSVNPGGISAGQGATGLGGW